MMLLPVLFVIGLHDWVPARWGSGDPKTLDLLRGSIVNCLLLETENWNGRFVESAAAKHLAILGVIHPGDAALDLARRAARMKLNGIVIEGDFARVIADRIRTEAGHNLAVIELPSRGRMRLDSEDPIVGTSQALWPGIEIQHGGTVSTGPTSAPWINTNTGFLRFVGAATKSTVWLGERPPPHTVLPAERYAVAIADAAITGARWIVALDTDLEVRLFTGDAGALDTWKQIDSYLRYFEEKREWREYRPYGELAIVEDTASGGLLSSGLLDMLAVQHTAARALPTRRLSNESLHGARVVLNVDASTLVDRQRRDIDDFASGGGKVVNPPAGWRFPETAAGAMTPTRREMDRIQPVWEATYNATVRKNFGARTFNTSSVIFDVRARPGVKSILVHLLNYTDYPSEDIALQVLGAWRRARLYTPEGPVRELPVYPVRDGTGIDISRIAVLGTVVVE
jgi:hypothetical protein